MMKSSLYAFVLAAAVASPALAQTAGSPASAGQFVSKATPGDWRASKLSGVAIYGPNKESIGKVSDVIVDKTGSSKEIVISVGGVLGMGSKTVAVPFNAIEWSDKPLEPARVSTNATGTAPSAPLASPAGTSNSAPMAANQPPAIYDYPDHGIISMTIDQLKAAPDFHYASEKGS